MSKSGRPPAGACAHSPRILARRELRLALLAIGTLGAAALAAAVGAPHPARAESPARDARVFASCDSLRWSAPKRVTIGGKFQAYVETPEIVRLRDSLLLLGGPSFAMDSTGDAMLSSFEGQPSPRFAGAMVGADGGGRMVPLPPGIATWNWPRVLPGRDGVDVLWESIDSSARLRTRQDSAAAPPASGASAGGAGDEVEIWRSQFDGMRWTAPVLLVRSPVVSWSQNQASEFARVGSRHALVVPVAWGSGDLALLVARDSVREGARWSVERVEIENLSYARLATHPRSGLILGYVAAGEQADSSARVTKTLYAARSSDGGKSWSERVRVSGLASGPVYDPQLLVAGDSAAYLTWLTRSDAGSRVHAAVSRDGGSSWREVEPFSMSGQMNGGRATLDETGRVHVIGRYNTAAESYSLSVSLSGARWRAARMDADGLIAASLPVVARPFPDSLVAAWGVVFDIAVTRPPILLVARAATRCAARP